MGAGPEARSGRPDRLPLLLLAVVLLLLSPRVALGLLIVATILFRRAAARTSSTSPRSKSTIRCPATTAWSSCSCFLRSVPSRSTHSAARASRSDPHPSASPWRWRQYPADRVDRRSLRRAGFQRDHRRDPPGAAADHRSVADDQRRSATSGTCGAGYVMVGGLTVVKAVLGLLGVVAGVGVGADGSSQVSLLRAGRQLARDALCARHPRLAGWPRAPAASCALVGVTRPALARALSAPQFLDRRRGRDSRSPGDCDASRRPPPADPRHSDPRRRGVDHDQCGSGHGEPDPDRAADPFPDAVSAGVQRRRSLPHRRAQERDGADPCEPRSSDSVLPSPGKSVTR